MAICEVITDVTDVVWLSRLYWQCAF